MRRWGWIAGGLGVVCLTASLAVAAERDTYQSARDAAAESKAKAEAKRKASGSSWWWPFGSSTKEESKPKETATAKTKAEKRPAEQQARAKPITAPLGLEGANLIAEEQAKFLRRQQVCDRIREAALARGDSSLEKQAQLLEQRAWFIYEQRTAQARMPSVLPIDDGIDSRKLTAEPSSKSRKPQESAVHSIFARSPATKTGGED
jgi:hypothetical protein